MKVSLYMAMTANGMIARRDDRTGWSREEWKSYHDKVQEVGNIVIGRRTFEIMKNLREFDRIGNPFTVVVTSENLESRGNFAFVKSPKEALNLLESKGFPESLVAGGSMLNSSFIREGLIDEIFIDIEPKLFGKGITLFAKWDFEKELGFIDSKHISSSTIQLHYKVKKDVSWK